jgi:hypothetical protein
MANKGLKDFRLKDMDEGELEAMEARCVALINFLEGEGHSPDSNLPILTSVLLGLVCAMGIPFSQFLEHFVEHAVAIDEFLLPSEDDEIH